MNAEPPAEELSPAEQRLVRLLALLRAERVDAPALASAVVRTARWQLVVRELARSLASIAVAVVEGAGLLFGFGAQGRRGRQ
jgi:hypothetical protein